LMVLSLTEGDGSALRTRIENSFPTATLAAVDLAISNWTDIQPADGELVDLIIR